MKKVKCVMLAAAMALSMAGCGGKGETGTIEEYGNLQEGVTEEGSESLSKEGTIAVTTESGEEKSDAAKRLVFRADDAVSENEFDEPDGSRRLVRIVFDGLTAHKPFISDLVEDTGRKVNILSANTKSVGGIGYGQMVVELPEEKSDQDIVLDYFKKSGLSVTEIEWQEAV